MSGSTENVAVVMLSAYPLPRVYRERFERESGMTPLYLNLSELRRGSLPSTLHQLASLHGAQLLLACEGREGSLLLPILESLGVVMRPGRIAVVGTDNSRSQLSRWHALPAIASLARASLEGQVAVATARRELHSLLDATRADVGASGGRRVLYLNGNLWIGLKTGGSIGHIAGVVNELDRAGYDVEMATFIEPIGVSTAVRTRVLSPPAAFGLPFETNQYRFQKTMARDLRSVRAGEIRFVYQRMSAGNYSGVPISRWLDAPLLLEYNGSEVWIAANWGTPLRHEKVALLAEEACLRHAQLVVTVSETLRTELLGRGVESERIVAHPNGVDPVVFDPARFDPPSVERLRAGYGIPPDAIVVGFVGTFGAWHGAEVLARAIALIAGDDRGFLEAGNVRFLFVGDGLGLPTVRETIESSAASPFVSFSGLVPQAEAPAHLAACDILVSPHVPNADGSPFFGSPTKLFEYMAMGKAIVASRLNQIGEVLEPSLDARVLPAGPPGGRERELAVTCEPGSEPELADALRFVVEQREWAAVLGRNARAAVLERYTWKHHVDAFLARIDPER